MSNFFDFDDSIENERKNGQALYLNKYLVHSLKDFAKSTKKDPRVLAEYFLSLGINSAKHYEDQNIRFDIKNL